MFDVQWPEFATPASFSLTKHTRAFSNVAGYSKKGQNVDILNDRWKVTLGISMRNRETAPRLEAFVNGLRRGISTVRLYHFGRQQILGTLTNPETLVTPRGSQTLNLQVQVGDFVKAGDMLGVGDQLFQVAFDAVATTTSLAVTLNSRVRLDIPSGIAVQTSQPTARFRVVGNPATSYGPGGVMLGLSLEFVEVIN